MSRKIAVGIDLGSTASEVAIMEGSEPSVVLTNEGARIFPSVVAINKNGERLVGANAKRQMLMNPKNTINLVKRFMGRRYDDPEVVEAKKHIQYEVVNHNGWAYIKLEGKEYSPQEISSWILAALKKQAEEYTGESITDAVITVPAMFPDSARTATKEAGEIAGLNVLRIINEPTAALLASRLDKSGKYMVCDFGGSTLDNSVADFDIESGTIEILASNGNTFLGGADIDNALAEYLVAEFKNETSIDLSKDSMAMQRVMDAVEKAKIELSSSVQTEVNLPYITAIEGQPQHLVMTVTKSKFEQLIGGIVDKVIKSAKDAIEASKVDKLDGIVLVGGSCRIPYVQSRLEKDLNTTLIKKADLDLAVAQGASIQSNILVGNTSSTDVLLLDVTPLSLGIETVGGVMSKMIEANTTIPTKKTEVFSTAADNQTSIQVVVAQGERPLIKDNKVVGSFFLDGIAPAPRGVAQIEITFDMDANGILTVTAVDKATGKSQNVTVRESTSLSKEEIERMKSDAESHKEEDEKKKEELQKMNEAESVAYSVEKAIESFGNKISEDEKKNLGEKVEKVKKSLKDRKIDDVLGAKKELEDAWNPIVQKLYSVNNGNMNGDSNPFNGMNPEDMMKNGFGGMENQQSNNVVNDDSNDTDFEEVK